MPYETPMYLDNSSSYAAGRDRLLLGSLLTPGVVQAGDLKVVQRAAGANMSVDVGTGSGVVAQDSPQRGAYLIDRSTTAVNVSIAAAPGSGTRIDYVIAEVRDSTISGAIDDWRVAVVSATSPSLPAVPARAYVLARIDVAAGTASVTNALIQDRRTAPRLRYGSVQDVTAVTQMGGSGQSIPNNTGTAVLWDSESLDENGNHSIASNTSKYNILVPGYYAVSARVRFASDNTTGVRDIWVSRNGIVSAGSRYGLVRKGGEADHTVHTAISPIPYPMEIGDYLEVFVFQNSGAAKTTSTTEHYTSAEFSRVG